MLDIAVPQIGVGVFHAWLFRGGADGWVSKVLVSTDARRPYPRSVIGSTVGAYPRGTGSNPVEGNGHFFLHTISSIFRISLTHTHTHTHAHTHQTLILSQSHPFAMNWDFDFDSWTQTKQTDWAWAQRRWLGSCSFTCWWRRTMTCSKWWRDKLMCLASFSWWPLTPDFATRSDPARSTRWSFDLEKLKQ